MLEARKVLYCDECGMPPEYCEYGPDFELVCAKWLQKMHPSIFEKLHLSTDEAPSQEKSEEPVPTEPWTTEERLHAFYSNYMPEKLDNVPSLLQKYEGKEEQLFTALVKKYGDEPDDPYMVAKYGVSDDDSDKDEDIAEAISSKLTLDDKKKRRGVAASKKSAASKEDVMTRILIQKMIRSRKKAVTIVHGMETIPNVKLKDASKAFSKRFAGSSSVKDSPNGKQKEIIIQGDHLDEVASFIVKTFKVSADMVFLDIDGDFVPFG